MKKVRLLVLGLAGVVSLALASPALAERTLVVTPSDYIASGAGTNTIEIAQADSDAPLAKVTLYAPVGYGSLLNEAPGATIGQVSAVVVIKALAGAKVPVTGAIQVDDPAKYTSDQAAVACAGAVRHDAVWLLRLSLQGQALDVPMYVDRVTQGPETGFAAFRMQVCFRSPDIPVAQGGQPNGVTPISARIALERTFSNPSTNGTYTWRAVFLPYTPGTGNVNVAGAVEARSLIQLPTQLTIKGSKVKRKVGKRTFTYAQLSGNITRVGVGVSGLSVRVLKNGKLVATVKSRAGGAWSVRIRITGRSVVTFSAQVVVPVSRVDAAGCAGAVAPPAARCESATAAPASVKSRGTFRIRP